MNKKMLVIGVLTAMSVVLGGCASLNPWGKADAAKSETAKVVTTAGVINQAPDWYLKNTVSTEYLYFTGSAVSQDMTMSVQKALLDAQHNAADRVNSSVSSFMKQYKRDTAGGYAENTELMVHKLVAEIKVGNYDEIQKAIVPEGNSFRSYVQLRFNMAKLMQQTNMRVSPQREADMSRELDRRVDAQKKGEAEAQ